MKRATTRESPKTRSGLTTSGHLSSHISAVLRPIFKVERSIERSLFQLHVSASKNAVKWRMCPSNANHCLCDVMHTLGCQDEDGFSLCTAPFRAISPVFHGRSKGLCVSYMLVPVRMPSNGASSPAHASVKCKSLPL